MSLVVIIGLVLSISGSVFTAITAMRAGWQKTVEEYREDSEDWFKSLQGAENASISDGYNKHKRGLNKALQFWDNAKWVPIGLLATVSLLIMIDVFFLELDNRRDRFF